MSILIFLAVIFLLVLVHEWGHFIVAKKTGMRVDEFAIGFPPKLFGIKKGETEYTFNLFPIGGFVRIFGENAVDAVDAPDTSRSFTSKSKWAQAAVLVAGVAMNVLFAWFLFSLALGLGVQTAVSEADATDAAKLIVTEAVPGSPAAESGLPIGAQIVTVEAPGSQLNILTPTGFAEFTRAHPDESITVTYTVGEETMHAEMAPSQGVIEGAADQYAVGVGLALIERVSRPVHVAIGEGFMMTLTSTRDIAIGIGTLLWDAVQFKADFSSVAGPVGIVSLVDDASAFGITTLIMFMAFISLNLAVINLLPFPALDGGRLLFVAIEAIKGTPMKPEFVGIFNMVGFFLLILLMVAVTVNDVVRIW